MMAGRRYLLGHPESLDVLRVLSESQNPMLSREIAEKLGIPKLQNGIISKLSMTYELITPSHYYIGKNRYTRWSLNPKFMSGIYELLDGN